MTKLRRITPPDPIEGLAARCGLRVLNGQIVGRHGRGPLSGARATVENGAQVGRRFTMTRLALLGPFALAVPKQTGKLFLTIEAGESAWIEEIRPRQEAAARQFAAALANRHTR